MPSRNDVSESDRLPAPLLEQTFDQVDVAPDAVHVGVDLQRAARILERAIVILESYVNLGVAGERAEVVRVALHDLIAIGKRLA